MILHPKDQIKAVIFDFDGTLADSLWMWRQVDEVFLCRIGKTCDETYIELMRNASFEDGAQITIDRYGLDLTPQAVIDAWLSIAIELSNNEIELKPGVLDYLKALNQAQIPYALATSSLPVLCMPVLRRYGIQDWFKAIITSEDIPRSKRSPDVFFKTSDALGFNPSEVVVFEDILMGIETAKKAGFYTAGIYDRYAQAEFQAIQKVADWSFRSWADVMSARFLID